MIKYILLSITLISSSAYAIGGGGSAASLDATCQFEYSVKANSAGEALVCKRVGGALTWRQNSIKAGGVQIYSFNNSAKTCSSTADKLIASIPVITTPAPVVRNGSACLSGETVASGAWISGTTLVPKRITKSRWYCANHTGGCGGTRYVRANVYSIKCQPAPSVSSYSNLCAK